jgi:hypothetical protein
MNKKQLIVAWVMVLSYCLTLLYFLGRYHYIISVNKQEGEKLFVLFYGVFKVITMYFVPVLIIGSLLIYTLRDKKK